MKARMLLLFFYLAEGILELIVKLGRIAGPAALKLVGDALEVEIQRLKEME